MITLEGTQSFSAPLEAVYSQLSDAGFLLGCVGPLISSEVDLDSARWTMKPTLGLVSGIVAGELTILERRPNQHLRIEQRIRGTGFTAHATTSQDFNVEDASTRVVWRLEILEVTGLLRMIPKAFLKAAAEKALEEIWQTCAAKIS